MSLPLENVKISFDDEYGAFCQSLQQVSLYPFLQKQ